ncbi:hypothetical protein ACE6H2_028041 [Prunus campanulata]
MYPSLGIQSEVSNKPHTMKFFLRFVAIKALISTPITIASSYFYGKLVARSATLALIAEEVDCLDVVPATRKYLADAIEPWLDGTFS